MQQLFKDYLESRKARPIKLQIHPAKPPFS
jgi:hypothetical protein